MHGNLSFRSKYVVTDKIDQLDSPYYTAVGDATRRRVGIFPREILDADQV